MTDGHNLLRLELFTSKRNVYFRNYRPFNITHRKDGQTLLVSIEILSFSQNAFSFISLFKLIELYRWTDAIKFTKECLSAALNCSFVILGFLTKKQKRSIRDRHN